jgi:putative hemolysin
MKLDYKLPGEGIQAYRTLAGFAMMRLGRVPKIEDQFVSDGLRFEVVDMDQNRVDKLIVSRIGGTAPSQDEVLGKPEDE